MIPFARVCRLPVLALVCVLAPSGCASPDPRPAYVTPSLAAGEAATIKASMGYWIREVDGARLPGPAPFTFSGNTVKVAPGPRAIGLGIPNGYFRFSYPFRAGHSYDFEGTGDAGGGVVKITDQTTGNSTSVGG
jgi:hypothetical protein